MYFALTFVYNIHTMMNNNEQYPERFRRIEPKGVMNHPKHITRDMFVESIARYILKKSESILNLRNIFVVISEKVGVQNK